jgi:chemotaxis protein methyltransferase CheR
LTTNKTDWFREPQHFNYLLENFLPQWVRSGKKHLKVWCAASSTGEEPYTLAIVLKKGLRNTDIDFSIFASDIDTRVLSIAENGVYKKERLWQVPEEFQDSFVFGTQEISSWMKVKREIKQHVQFGQVNLAQGPYPWREEYDLIFCRNVLIYFNQDTIEEVVENLYPAAKKDALLFIAHSESLQNVSTQWNYKKASI